MAAIAEIMDRAEAAARARTRTIPDGVYEAESFWTTTASTSASASRSRSR